MYGKRLYILIEGDDDKRFFEKIIKPMFREKYNSVALWQYSRKKKAEVNEYLNNIKEKWDADYIFVTDLENMPCVTKRKQERQEEFDNIDDKDRIIVVIKKIESWYLALLDDDACRKYGIDSYNSTNGVGKGQFKNRIPKKFRGSGIAFMQDILKNHVNPASIETAKQKNTSLSYFIKRYDLQWSQ